MTTITLVCLLTIIINIGIHVCWIMSLERRLERLKEYFSDTRDLWYKDSIQMNRKLRALEKKQ